MILTLLMFGSCEVVHQGNQQYKNFGVDYDVTIEQSIYKLTANDQVLYHDQINLVFETHNNLTLGHLVVTEDNMVNIITDQDGKDLINRYRAIPYKSNILKNGKISIYQTTPLPLGQQIDVPICFGFNADRSCRSPLQDLILFSNPMINVDCDNCFSSLYSDLFIDIEFSEFHIKSIALGMKNVHLWGGLGVTAKGHDNWSYAYNKIYSLINKMKLISFSIGLVDFDIFLDFPVEVDFRASSSGNAEIKYGLNLDIDLGNLYMKYDNGQWKMIKSQPVITTKPYLSSHESVNGVVHFAIKPVMSLYCPKVFQFNLNFDPYTDLTLVGSSTSKNMCINGKYQLDATFDGSIMDHPFDKMVLYDTGVKEMINQCYPIEK